MPKRILVADDEPKIVQIVSAYLEAAGFEAIPASDGTEALRRFREASPDCAVLDINMPHMDGLDVARSIRRTSDAPILFLTARVEETDRIVGLELGADDYIVKPFSPRELVARVKAVLRRYAPEARPSEPGAGDTVGCGAVSMDLLKRTVIVRGERVELTKVQFDILRVLISEPGRVFTRGDLLESALGTTFEGYDRAIDAHIKNLRKVLGDDGDSPRYIGTVRGVGYKFLEAGG